MIERENNIMVIQDIAPQFTYQGPRFKELGPNSGEEFRDDYLIPWLIENHDDKQAVIDFAGTRMFSPSFLEEAFGGAVRKGYGEKIRQIKFLNVPRTWGNDLRKYISEALRYVR
ncbi:MAG: STAS-like domain-containing protein [Sphaerochaeta sp.]|jgi:hypothetical protein|nr:STAS-like domain-containing protein [Sphaerochaeta sp.]MDX9915576.1 STAS-like domain-containing protein [Sphaerochaeta sp.]